VKKNFEKSWQKKLDKTKYAKILKNRNFLNFCAKNFSLPESDRGPPRKLILKYSSLWNFFDKRYRLPKLGRGKIFQKTWPLRTLRILRFGTLLGSQNLIYARSTWGLGKIEIKFLKISSVFVKLMLQNANFIFSNVFKNANRSF
jgi:hypothetical protein